MTKHTKLQIIVLSSFLLLSFDMLQEVNTNQIDKEYWQEITKDLNFDRDVNKNEQPEARIDTRFNVYQFSELVRILLITTAILILSIIIYKISKGGFSFNKKLSKVEITGKKLEDLEENLLEADLEPHYQAAVASGNYKLATRILYLISIKKLNELGHLKWKKDKTNQQYISDIKTKSIKGLFKSLTLIFEWVWYGNHNPSETVFQETKYLYEQLFHEVSVVRGNVAEKHK